jgi:hypothetical protein
MIMLCQDNFYLTGLSMQTDFLFSYWGPLQSQDQNGIYWACLRNEWRLVDCATTKFTRAEIDQWLEEHGVKSLLFEDGEQLDLATK